MIQFNNGLITIERDWVSFKSIADGTQKALGVNYEEYIDKYEIFAIDDIVVYRCEIFKDDKYPASWVQSQVETNAANRTDFETNFKTSSNKAIRKLDSGGHLQTTFSAPQLVFQKPIAIGGTRAWIFSHDFTDKTSWYGDAISVVNELVGTGNGALTTFNLSHTDIIDITHGKTPEENDLIPSTTQGGTTFKPIIKVNDVTKTERLFGETTDGDYEINYATGAITFFTAPSNTHQILATYFYATNSTMYIRPAPGKKLTITRTELMFSKDFVITDETRVAVFTYNPSQGAPPAKFLYPPSLSTFKTFWDWIAWSRGSFPIIPVLGVGARMSTKEVLQLVVEYIDPIILDSAIGAELRFWNTNHKAFTGEVACFTAYGIED